MAIALDTSVSTARSDGVTSLTQAFTCTGSNLILLVHILGDSSLDTISGVTYNGVAMTQVDKKQMPAGSTRWSYMYALVAPATGTHDIVASAGSAQSIAIAAASYTGAKQTGQPDSFGDGTASAVTSLTTSTTVVATGCWTVYGTLNDTGAPSAGTGATMRQATANGQGLSDSNGTVGTGSQSQQHTRPGNSAWVGIIVSIAPPVVTTTGNMFSVF